MHSSSRWHYLTVLVPLPFVSLTEGVAQVYVMVAEHQHCMIQRPSNGILDGQGTESHYCHAQWTVQHILQGLYSVQTKNEINPYDSWCLT